MSGQMGDLMTLHLDLIRTLLLHLEKHARDAWIDLAIEEYDEPTVSECVQYLDGLGYVETVIARTFEGEIWKSVRLTPKGNQLLAAARDDRVWGHAQAKEVRLIEGGNPEELKWLLHEATEEMPGP